MAEIRWTREAADWLEDIHKYIAQDNPEMAEHVVNSIYNEAQLLKELPKIGYLYSQEKEGEVRILLYGHYRIAYLVRKDNMVEIIGVFHGALDLARYL